MNYKKKRIGAGLSAYTMSKEMEIPYEKYLLVEKKRIPLEGSLLDKFQTILKNAKMIKFNHKQKMHDIKRAIDKGELRDRMSKMGFNGMTLARELGIAPSEVSHVLNNKNSNDERVEMVYDFLMNPLNANVDTSKTDEVKIVDMSKTKEMMNEKGITVRDIAKALKMSVSGVHQHIGKHYENRTDKKINSQKQKIVDFVTNYEPKKELVVEITPAENDVIERVKEIKDRNNLSMNDIANECGMSPSHLYKLLTGYRGTSPASYKALKDFADKYENEDATSLIDVEKIKKIIEENNLLKQDIEEELNISKGYLSKILNGASKPSKVLADEIKEYFAKYEKSPQTETEDEELSNILTDIETNLDEAENTENEPINIEDIDVELDNNEYIKIAEPEINYFDLLKENYDLKGKLAKAERQIMMYEKLIERLK